MLPHFLPSRLLNGCRSCSDWTRGELDYGLDILTHASRRAVWARPSTILLSACQWIAIVTATLGILVVHRVINFLRKHVTRALNLHNKLEPVRVGKEWFFQWNCHSGLAKQSERQYTYQTDTYASISLSARTTYSSGWNFLKKDFMLWFQAEFLQFCCLSLWFRCFLRLYIPTPQQKSTNFRAW